METAALKNKPYVSLANEPRRPPSERDHKSRLFTSKLNNKSLSKIIQP
jgi:hypothetical protein